MAAAEAKALDEGWPEVVAIEDRQRPPILLMHGRRGCPMD